MSSWRLWLVLPALLYPSTRAYAQSNETSTPAVETAQDWFQRGVSLSRAAQWSEARAAYERSLRLEPRVSTYYNLATSSLKLRLGRATLLAIDDFERLADPRVHADFLAEAARMRAEALDLTGTVILAGSPPAATVEIDQEVRRWPVGPEHQISLDPGHHMLRLDAPGYITSSLEVDVARGVTTRLSPAWSRPAASDPAPVARAHATPEDDSSREAWLWGGVVAAVALGALSAVVVLAVQGESERAPRGAGGSLDMVFE